MPYRLLGVASKFLPDACSPGTFCTTQIVSGLSAITAALAPASVDNNVDFAWLWRGLITASLLLNLFFLKSIYRKVQSVGKHRRAIATLQVAVEYLAVEAVEHGIKRQADTLIVGMLRDVKKLVEESDDTEA